MEKQQLTLILCCQLQLIVNIHNQKTKGFLLRKTKSNFDFTLSTTIYSFWCEENIVLVLQVIILFVDGYSVEFCRISTEIIPKAGGNGR